ncbi:MAG: 16S rRNA (cytosine(1402)-N(4))-methyltransferase, partial [Elusimicrobia bacterium]|nr:16S rRNA (cytosine(1402)-N(4))-methyltransferase [Elusimicrobiota bacterium]
GEPRAARRLSRTVLAEFSAGRLKTNADLARLCERIIGRRGPRHPATRVFLAIRAAVNDEMGVLRQVLDAAPRCLAVGGRLAVITFHSLEDRAAKERFRALAHEGENGRAFALINKKPIVPSRGEQARNPRSRSAKLRVLERVS